MTINNIKDNRLAKPISGINQLVHQPKDAIGIDIGVRTQTPGSDIKTIINTRYVNDPEHNTINGILRIPKQMCEYYEFGNRDIGYYRFGVPVSMHNIIDAPIFKVYNGYEGKLDEDRVILDGRFYRYRLDGDRRSKRGIVAKFGALIGRANQFARDLITKTGSAHGAKRAKHRIHY